MCVNGVGEAHVERVVVLHQGGVAVVEDQFFQAAVEVEGLGEAEAPRRAVDHAVFHLAVHPEENKHRFSLKVRSMTGHVQQNLQLVLVQNPKQSPSLTGSAFLGSNCTENRSS